MNVLGLFRSCAEEADRECTVVNVNASRRDLRSASFFGVLGCLLVLGVDEVVEVVKADDYYWDHAVDRSGFRS